MTEPRIEQTATRIVVELTLAAPAPALFAVLADPTRHAELDASGMVQAAAGSERITATDQIFTMAMYRDDLGDYRTDNLVAEFDEGRHIAWLTSREGLPPAGQRWSWALESIDDGHTAVAHTYDWSAVTDPDILARVTFPRVSAEELVASMRRLEAAAT